jgi:hypothetical protein
MATVVSESTNESVKEISKLANEYGTDFVNLFYKSLDTKRHVNHYLYNYGYFVILLFQEIFVKCLRFLNSKELVKIKVNSLI